MLGRDALDACLAELLKQCAGTSVEVVVARSFEAEEYRALERAYPKVLFMPAATHSSRAQLCSVGTAAAEGDVVFLTDDRAPPPPGFVSERLRTWSNQSRACCEPQPVNWMAYFGSHAGV